MPGCRRLHVIKYAVDQFHAPFLRQGEIILQGIISLFLAGDTVRNILAAQKYCRYAADSGYIPFAAHLLYPQFLNDEDKGERELGLFFGNILMDKCDEVWIFGSVLSAGMQAEYDRAVKKGYRIRRFTTDCREVTGHGNGGGDGPV